MLREPNANRCGVNVWSISSSSKFDTLRISHHQMTSLDGIAHLPLLRRLFVEHSPQVTLEGLKAHRTLRVVVAAHTKLQSLDGLAGCEALEWLDLRRVKTSKISDAWRALATLPLLRALDLDETKAPDVLPRHPELDGNLLWVRGARTDRGCHVSHKMTGLNWYNSSREDAGLWTPDPDDVGREV